MRDISQRRRLEEQLRHAQKMEALGRLAGGVAHDFNNLLTAILGYTNLILAELDEGSPLRQDILEVQAAGQRAASLTHHLLAFSRRQVLQPELLEVNTLVANLGLMLQRLIGENIDLVLALQPTPAWIKADPGQLEQVIINLAVNARDAMPEGGRLRIETSTVSVAAQDGPGPDSLAAGTYVRIAIIDTGHGIDLETQSRIFEPFVTTKAPGQGTGLGLAMVHGIVSQSGGQIEVASQPNQGCTFTIYLPETPEDDTQVRRAPLSTPAPVGSETILLVEDDEAVRKLAKGVLSKHGYIVLDAPDGPAALDIVQTYGHIDLLVTDVIMPGGLSGIQLVKLLLKKRPLLKVLYISGYTDNMMVDKDDGAIDTGFLQKPFTADSLTRQVRMVLDS